MNRRLVAVLLSGLVCPGAGQLYNRRYVRGGLMVAVSLGIVTAVVYQTWDAMLDIALEMPPDQILGDPFAVSAMVMEAKREFLSKAGWAFLIVWAYGIVDAAFLGGGRRGDG